MLVRAGDVWSLSGKAGPAGKVGCAPRPSLVQGVLHVECPHLLGRECPAKIQEHVR